MSMRLDAEHLEMLIDKLQKLESTEVEVKQFRMGNHTVWLDWERDGTAGPRPIVVGISQDQKEKAGGGNLRERPASGGY